MSRRYHTLLVVAVLSCLALQLRVAVCCSVSSDWSLQLPAGPLDFFQAAVLPSPYCQSLLERGSDDGNANHALYAVDLSQGRLAWQWKPQLNDSFDAFMRLTTSSAGHRVYLSPFRPLPDGRLCSVMDAIDTVSGSLVFSHSVCSGVKRLGWANNVLVLANSSDAEGRERVVHYLPTHNKGENWQLAIAVLDATTGQLLSVSNVTVESFGVLTAVGDGRDGFLLYEAGEQEQQRSFLLQVDANSSDVHLVVKAPAVTGVELYSQPLLTRWQGQLRAVDALNGSLWWSSSDPFMLGHVNLSSSSVTYHTYYTQLDAYPDYFAVLNAAISNEPADGPLSRLGQLALYRLWDGQQLSLSPVLEFHTDGPADSLAQWIWWYELDGALLIATFDARWQWYRLSLPSLKLVSHGHYPHSGSDSLYNCAVSADGSFITVAADNNTVAGHLPIIDRAASHRSTEQSRHVSRTA